MTTTVRRYAFVSAIAALTLVFGGVLLCFTVQPGLASFADDSVSYLVMAQVWSPWHQATAAVRLFGHDPVEDHGVAEQRHLSRGGLGACCVIDADVHDPVVDLRRRGVAAGRCGVGDPQVRGHEMARLLLVRHPAAGQPGVLSPGCPALHAGRETGLPGAYSSTNASSLAFG